MVSVEFKQMWTKGYVRLFLTEFFLQLGMQSVMPITSNAAVWLGASIALGGVLAGLCSISAMIFRFASGPVFSRFAKKPMLCAATIGFCITSWLFALFPNIGMLAITRVIFGLCIMIKTVMLVTICSLLVPKSSTARAVAWLTMVQIFASAVCPAVAKEIAAICDYSVVFMVSGTCMAIAIVLSLMLPDVSAIEAQRTQEEKDAQTSANTAEANTAEGPVPASAATAEGQAEAAEAPGKSPSKAMEVISKFYYLGAIPVTLLGLGESFIYGTIQTLTLLAGEMRGLDNIAMFYVVYVVVSFASRPIASALYEKWGFLKACTPMFFLMMLAMFTFAFTDSTLMIVVDGVLFALGQGCLWPCLQAESIRGVPTQKTPLAINTLMLGIDLGMFLGPFVGGALLEMLGATGLYLFNAGIGIILIIGLIPYAHLERKRKERGEAA